MGIEFTSTNIVIPVALRNAAGKYLDVCYKLECHSSFPNLGITISYGVQGKMKPKEELAGYVSSSISRFLYQPVIAVTFDKQFNANYERQSLIDEPVGLGGNIRIYNGDGSTTDTTVSNHLELINKFVIPKVIEKITDSKNKEAKFNSWLLVGLNLLTSLKMLTTFKDNDSLATTESIDKLTQKQLMTNVLEAYQLLKEKHCFITESHKQIAERIKLLPAFTEVKAIEANK